MHMHMHTHMPMYLAATQVAAHKQPTHIPYYLPCILFFSFYSHCHFWSEIHNIYYSIVDAIQLVSILCDLVVLYQTFSPDIYRT